MKAYATDIATALAYYLPTNISQPTAQLIANDVVKLDAHLFAFSGAAVPPSSMTEVSTFIDLWGTRHRSN